MWGTKAIVKHGFRDFVATSASSHDANIQALARVLERRLGMITRPGTDKIALNRAGHRGSGDDKEWWGSCLELEIRGGVRLIDSRFVR